jgi:hypothetical protein
MPVELAWIDYLRPLLEGPCMAMRYNTHTHPHEVQLLRPERLRHQLLWRLTEHISGVLSSGLLRLALALWTPTPLHALLLGCL